MPRPTKCRIVESKPDAVFFKPRGIPMALLEEINLTLEEVEAIRLKDLESLNQAESSERMDISRATFQRILSSARKKISDALINGKAIRIEGGNYLLVGDWLQCAGCAHEWKRQAGAETCPNCGDSKAIKLAPKRCGRSAGLSRT